MTESEKKYIVALQTFTGALDEIVKLLEQQAKNNTADVVVDFLKTPMNELVTVVEDLKKINETGFAAVKNQNETILKKIESIKQQKESGMFENIEDPKNKDKIVDGIKVVMLIAGGVLALGMAFKIIGKVDFLSVIALSGAMLIMAKAYSDLAQFKDLTFAEIFRIGSILPIMSLGLLLSGIILSRFPSISLMQGISILVVGATIGVATHLLLDSLKNVELDWKTILKLPVIMPLVATGLLLSGLILKYFPNFSWMQGLSLVLVAGAVGVATWFLMKSLKKVNIIDNWKTFLSLPIIMPLVALGLLFSGLILQSFPTFGLMQSVSLILVGAAMGITTWLLFKSLGKVDIVKNWATFLALPLILPLVALGLVGASYILQRFKPLKEPVAILIGSAVIGLSVLFFAPAILILGKMKLADVLTGIAIILPLAWVITKTSQIFQNFVPLNNPLQIGLSTLSMGLSILLFVPTIFIVGKMKLNDILSGILAIPLIAGVIVATAWMFQLLPKDMIYPDYKWTFGAGLSIGAFGLLIYGIGYLAKNKQFWIGLAGVTAVAVVILAVDAILSKGSYSKSPSFIWLLGSALTIGAFGLLAYGIGYLAKNKQFWVGLAGITSVAVVILAVDVILSKGSYSKAPSFIWLLGSALTIGAFGLLAYLVGFIATKSQFWVGLAGITSVAVVILAVDFILSKGSYSKSPSFDWMINTGLAIAGTAIVAFLVGFLAMTPTFWVGLAGITAIAAVILATDAIIGIGNYSKYPSLDWLKGVGLSIVGFGVAAGVLGLIILTGVGAVAMAAGLLGILTIAASMVAVDKILGLGSFTKYPSEEWASGISKSMALFTGMDKDAGVLDSIGNAISGFIKGVGGSTKGITMIAIASTMVAVDNILNKGSFTKYPSDVWSIGVSKSITLFTANSGGIINSVGNIAKAAIMIKIASSMIEVDNILNKGSFTKYPSEEWSKGVSKSMALFTGTDQGVVSAFKGVLKGMLGSEKAESMISIATSIVSIDKILSSGKYDTYPSLEWVNNINNSIMRYISITTELIPLFDKYDSGDVDKYMNRIISNMIFTAQLLNTIDWNTIKYPSKDYFDNFTYLMLEMNKIVTSINTDVSMDDFLEFSINSTLALVQTSHILNSGQYTNFPNSAYISMFTAFIVAISETMNKADFNVSDSTKFLNSTSIVIPAVSQWIQMLSKGDFNSSPTKSYTDNFKYYVISLGTMINEWKELGLSLSDFENFDKSMKSITSAIDKLKNLPIINANATKNMQLIRESIVELLSGVDAFMYEERTSVVGKVYGAIVGGKKKRSMEDFLMFSNGLQNIMSGLQILATLKPISGGALKGYTEFLGNLKELPDMTELDIKSTSINKLAMSLLTLSNSLSSVNSNLQGFNNLSKGLFLISIIDDTKLDNVLKSVDKYKTTLQLVNQLPEEQTNLLSTIKGLYETLSNPTEGELVKNETTNAVNNELELKSQKQFYSDISDIKNLLYQFKDSLDKPSQAGSFRST